jgi:hypothetical protein
VLVANFFLVHCREQETSHCWDPDEAWLHARALCIIFCLIHMAKVYVILKVEAPAESWPLEGNHTLQRELIYRSAIVPNNIYNSYLFLTSLTYPAKDMYSIGWGFTIYMLYVCTSIDSNFVTRIENWGQFCFQF